VPGSVVYAYTDSDGFGGAEEALKLLLVGLADRGWRPSLLHGGADGLEPLVSAVRARGIPDRVVPAMPEGLRGATQVAALARVLRQDRPDVFHAHMTWPFACKWALAAACAARVPAVLGTTQLFVDLGMDASRRTQAWLLSRRVDRMIAVSQDTRDRLHREMGWPLHRLTVIPNAIAVDAYARSAGAGDPAGIDDGSGRPVALVPARLDAQKGHRYLLAAARQLPGVRFVCAGSGVLSESLADQARDLGVSDRVAFVGFRRDIAALLHACDLVVLPSLNEGLPLALIEAMAAGKPVVATDIGGTRELVVHEETGLLVAPRDPTALAGAIARVVQDRALAQQLGHAGRRRAREHFSADSMVRAVEREYRAALDAARVGRIAA
jgi:glycosyltransferase involved in cell wall biosynthesis